MEASSPEHTAGVTLVSAVRLRPAADAAHRVLQDSAVARARESGGLLRAELVPAIPEVQPETVALLTFASRPALDRWLGSPERAEVLGETAELIEGDRTTTVIVDFAGWFDGGATGSPERWKQALVVICALIPVALVTSALRSWLAPGIPPAAGVALVSAVNAAILTWGVMPLVTRSLQTWLGR